MSTTIHELEAALETARTPRERIDALTMLAEHLRHADLDRTRRLATEAHALAMREDYPKGIADSINHLAWCDYRAGDLNAALEHVLAACELAEQNDGLEGARAKALSIIGLIHLQTGNFPLALEQLLKALDLARAVGDLELVAGVTNDIGLIYMSTQDFTNALEQLQASLELDAQLDTPEQFQAVTMNNMACVYSDLSDFDNAMLYFQKALDIHCRVGFQRGRGVVLVNLGEIHVKQGDIEQGLTLYHEALALARADNAKDLICETLTYIASALITQGQADQALPYLEEAQPLAEAINHGVLRYRTHELFAQACEQMGQFEQALDHHKQFHRLKETIFNHDADSRLKTMQIVYQVETAHRDKETYRLRAEALERERLQAALDKEQELNRMKTGIMLRISHEFRTPLAIILTTTQLLTQYLNQLPEDKRQKHRDTILAQVSRLTDLLDDITSVLRTSYDRLEFDPQTTSVIAACQAVLDDYRKHSRDASRIVARMEPSDRSGAIDVRLLSRMITGLLDNALKFSDGPVVFEVHQEGDDVVLSVSDDGIGIEPDEQATIFEPFVRGSNSGEIPGIGLGLTIVRDCVTLHNGTIELASAPGKGTTFTIRLPLR
jgi:signal transduction histidine kinase